MTYDSLLIHTCYRGWATSSQNSLGEWKYAWTYAHSSQCRASPLTASQRVEFVGLFDNVTYTLFLPSGSGFKITSPSGMNRVLFEGKYYKINDLRYDSSHHHITALISELP